MLPKPGAEDFSPFLRSRQVILTERIEAVRAVKGSSYWQVIAEDFKDELSKLNRRLRAEKESIEIFRLQGKIEGMEKYTDLDRLEKEYLSELEKINKQLNAKIPHDGA